MPKRGGYNTRRHCWVHGWDCPHPTAGECIDAHPVEWDKEAQGQLEAHVEYWRDMQARQEAWEREQADLALFLP